MTNLRGKRVLITGGGRGIGRQIALAFAREGAELVVADLMEDALASVADELRAAGAKVSTYRADVTDADSIAELRSRVHADAGPIDVLVNNAGTAFGGLFLDVPMAKHLLTYQVNTIGLMAMTHAFLPDLIARPEGHLVNIASASGFVGLPYGGTYASSKWAVIGLSESLRLELRELGHQHVHVVTVCPSYVRTELFAGVTIPRTTRVLEPEELAREVVAGVRKNKVYVLAPSIVHLTPILKGILPRALFDWSCRWFGINTSMRPWRGRPVVSPDDTTEFAKAAHANEPRVPVGDRR